MGSRDQPTIVQMNDTQRARARREAGIALDVALPPHARNDLLGQPRHDTLGIGRPQVEDEMSSAGIDEAL